MNNKLENKIIALLQSDKVYDFEVYGNVNIISEFNIIKAAKELVILFEKYKKL